MSEKPIMPLLDFQERGPSCPKCGNTWTSFKYCVFGHAAYIEINPTLQVMETATEHLDVICQSCRYTRVMHTKDYKPEEENAPAATG